MEEQERLKSIIESRRIELKLAYRTQELIDDLHESTPFEKDVYGALKTAMNNRIVFLELSIRSHSKHLNQ